MNTRIKSVSLLAFLSIWHLVWIIGLLGLSAGRAEAEAVVPKLSAGAGHSVMLGNDGTLFAVGSDGNGELGQGHDAIISPVPLRVAGSVSARKTAAGRMHSVALTRV